MTAAENASGASWLWRRFCRPVRRGLTILWHCRAMHRASIIPLLCLGLAACADDSNRTSAEAALIARDPVVARALHDPLMTDPDLASRNDANAALGFVDSHALPVIAAPGGDAMDARELLRLELLETGPIPDLPLAQQAAGRRSIGPLSSPADLLGAVGAPGACAARLREDFALAATLPRAAAIPKLAMVVQAGGADVAPCRIRIIRYTIAAASNDVLHYHYVQSGRAGLIPQHFGTPAPSIAAAGQSGEQLAVHVRPAAHGLTGVTLIYRAP